MAPRLQVLTQLSGPSPHPSGCGRAAAQLGYEFEPHLAVDPLDPDHLIASWQQDRNTNRGALSHRLEISRDGGRTWSSTEAPGITTCPSSGSRGLTDPWSSLAPDGMAYTAAGVMGESGGPQDIVVGASTDGGDSFGEPVSLLDPVNYLGGRYPDKEVVSADPYRPGSAYAIWTRVSDVPEAIPRTLQFSATTDGGSTWSPERTVYVQPQGKPYTTVTNELLVLPGGTLLAFFLEWGAGDVAAEQNGDPAPRDSTVELLRSDDYGMTWSEPITVAEHGNLDGVDPDGNRILAGVFPAAARAPGGAIDVVWPDMRDATHGAIRMATSLDQGRTWSKPRTVVENDAHPSTPAVAVARNGTIGVLYNDFSSDRPDDQRTDLDAWLAVSRDRGRTWSRTRLGRPSDIRRGPDAMRLGDYDSVVAMRRAFGAIFVATPPPATDGLTDVFYARVRVDRPPLHLAIEPVGAHPRRRTRFRLTVTGGAPGGPVPVAGARVRFCGEGARTGRGGRVWMRCPRGGSDRRIARATKRGYRPVRAVTGRSAAGPS